MRRILNEDVPFLTLPLPDGRGGTMELELVKVNIFAPGFTVNVASTGKEVVGNLGAHYRGIVKGDNTSVAAISVFENEVMGFFSTQADGNVVLGRLTGNNPNDRHVLYNDRDLKAKDNFSCDTDDSDALNLPSSIIDEPSQESPAVTCVKMYVEADYPILVDKGSVTAVRNFVTGIFNQSATLYNNDTIPVALSQLVIWDVPSPFVGTTTTQLLDQFTALRNGNFRGDTGHLLSYRVQNGGVAWTDILCSGGNQRTAYSGIDPDFMNVPTYSWTINLFTHEAGHNLASPHTHACAWNGNNTAIDSCAAVEGNCPSPGNPPGGGTIMSYCHNVQGVGINFANGFGPQPKALILQRIAAGACLTDCAVAPVPRRAFDFDGDGRADVSVYRPADGVWHILNSTSGYTGTAFGIPTDSIAPADYDGDGRTDFGVYRNGTWYLQRTKIGFRGVAFGAAGDLPRPGDFDGDGLADICVFRPSNGGWYRINSGDGQAASIAFGQMGDVPVIGDFDGDGKSDQAVFRPSTGAWYIQRSQLGFTGLAFGATGDIPAPADFDGDGKTDIAVFRPSTGTWYIQRSQLGFTGVGFGTNGDVPAAADYDGDGRADVAVYRPGSGAWYLLRSTEGFTGVAFGIATDVAVPAAYGAP
jgi:hypothetical protein